MLKIDSQLAIHYSRQIVLQDVDLDGQEALLNGSALMIGAGGLGTACSLYLVSSGLGKLTLVDDDHIDPSNLPRQCLYQAEHVGQLKAPVAAQVLAQHNPNGQISPITERLDDEQLKQLIMQHHIVIDCTDNLTTRNQLNRLCHALNVPLVCGAAIRFEGQITTFLPNQDQACYACLSALFGEQDLSCVESGIMSPVVGIIGAMQALEAIKIIMQIGQTISGRLMIFDGKTSQWRSFNLPKRPNCSVCGNLNPHLKKEKTK